MLLRGIPQKLLRQRHKQLVLRFATSYFIAHFPQRDLLRIFLKKTFGMLRFDTQSVQFRKKYQANVQYAEYRTKKIFVHRNPSVKH